MEDDEEQMNTISMEEKSNSYTQSDQAFADTSTVDPDSSSSSHQVFARSSMNWKIECSNTFGPTSASIQTLKPAFNGEIYISYFIVLLNIFIFYFCVVCSRIFCSLFKK